jgi:ADP-ribosylglycohydrolase
MDPDHIRGMLWGAACGSALGLHYHGKDPMQRGETLPEPETFSAKPETPHGKHPPGAFSALLEPAILALQKVHKTKKVFVPESGSGTRGAPSQTFLQAYAEALYDWTLVGIREWGDSTAPYEMDYQTLETAKDPVFRTNPLHSASVAHSLQNDCAALLRALAAATMPTPEAAEEAALLACRVTHRSQSLTAATCFAALVLQSLLYYPLADWKQSTAWASVRAGIHVQGGARERLFKALREKVLVKIGGRDHQGLHSSSMRCFVFAFRLAMQGDTDPEVAQGGGASSGVKFTKDQLRDLWRSAVGTVCIQGGSADVNGALVGAVLGARHGMDAVPDWYREMPHADWLEAEIEAAVASATSSPEPAQQSPPEAAPATVGPLQLPPRVAGPEFVPDF